MAGDKSPFIVLQISRSDWLNNILKSWPVPDSSGEALLFRRSGDQIQFLNDVRYRPGSALTLHLPVSSKELLAVQFLQQSRNEEGKALFFGKDYRNTPVFGTVQPVMGTDWYLLAKIDKAELTRAELKESIWIGLIGLLVLLIANTGIVLLRQHTRLQMAEQVRQSQALPAGAATAFRHRRQLGRCHLRQGQRGQIYPVQPRRQPVRRQIGQRDAGSGRHGHLSPIRPAC